VNEEAVAQWGLLEQKRAMQAVLVQRHIEALSGIGETIA